MRICKYCLHGAHIGFKGSTSHLQIEGQCCDVTTCIVPILVLSVYSETTPGTTVGVWYIYIHVLEVLAEATQLKL